MNHWWDISKAENIPIIKASKIKNDPQAPEPVNTGDLKEIKLSWPDPLLIQLPAEELKSSLLWVTFKNLISSDEIVSKEGLKFQFWLVETVSSSFVSVRKEKLEKNNNEKKTKCMRDYIKKAGKFPYLLLGGG